MIYSLTPCLWVTVSMLLWVVVQPSSFSGASNPASFSGTLASTWEVGTRAANDPLVFTITEKALTMAFSRLRHF